jgi:hypothetical protein
MGADATKARLRRVKECIVVDYYKAGLQ